LIQQFFAKANNFYQFKKIAINCNRQFSR